MARYSIHNIHPPHDLHYSWTGWPSGVEFSQIPQPGVLDGLAASLKTDNLELESHTWQPDQVHLTVAATPDLVPAWIAQRLKGRLAHELRQSGTKAPFSRKVSLRAIGHNRTSTVDRYIRDQLEHVDLADPRYRQTLASVAVNNPAVDLTEPAVSNRGHYWYNLHVVLVVESRYRIGESGFLDQLRDQVMKVSATQNCALRRVALMPDHMHIALRGNPKLSPAEIAVGIQEATSDVAGCRLWENEFYVGTFGDYDYGAVKGAGGGGGWRSPRPCAGGE